MDRFTEDFLMVVKIFQNSRAHRVKFNPDCPIKSRQNKSYYQNESYINGIYNCFWVQSGCKKSLIGALALIFYFPFTRRNNRPTFPFFFDFFKLGFSIPNMNEIFVTLIELFPITISGLIN